MSELLICDDFTCVHRINFCFLSLKFETIPVYVLYWICFMLNILCNNKWNINWLWTIYCSTSCSKVFRHHCRWRAAIIYPATNCNAVKRVSVRVQTKSINTPLPYFVQRARGTGDYSNPRFRRDDSKNVTYKLH